MIASQLDKLMGGAARRVVLVNAEAITDIDSTAVQALGELLDELDGLGVRLALARVHRHLRLRLDNAGLADRIGSDYLFREVDDAVEALSVEPSSSR
jgi:anti-anti-sigma regulatory factor